MTIDVNTINNSALQQSSKSKSPAAEKAESSANQSKQPNNSDADAIHITDEAQLLQQLQHEISQLPEIDRQRVDAIKKAITDGTYTVDTKNVAEKLLDLEQSLQATE